MVATRGNRFITIVLDMFWPKQVPVVMAVGGLVLLFGQMGVATSLGSDDAAVFQAPAPPPGFGAVPTAVLQDTCPVYSLYAQSLENPPTWVGVADDAFPFWRYESFSGLSAEVCDVHWWGVEVDTSVPTNCVRPNNTFEIKFYNDAGGFPGAQVCSYTVTPTRTNTGLVFGPGTYDWPIYEYGTDVVPCCAISDGWISIQAVGGTMACSFWAASAATGDGGHYVDDGGGLVWDATFDVSFCLTPEETQVYKWDQPPVVVHPDYVYTGWDEFSVWNYEVVADDWVCESEDPITHIHWWGSYPGWRKPYPPPVEPDHWHILIWTDVPAGVDATYSHPGKVIHEIITPNANVTREFVGWDIYEGWVDSTFQYNYTLDASEYFYQEDVGGIYWITIAACYEPNYPPEYPWGWKTRPRDPTSPAPDDAVIIWNPWAPVLGSEYVDGFPIEWPAGESWDMAFELYTNPPPEVVKWDQPPTIDPDWDPEYYFGWNELSEYFLGQIVADDWGCNDDRPITDIHWWGSYFGWLEDFPPPDAPELFHIGIWRDVPANPPEFSHPDDMIWEWIVPRSELNERWVNYDYHPDWGYESCFQYDFYIPSGDWFVQDPATENVYWLSISAMRTVAPIWPWGWKTRRPEWNDDAIRIFDPIAPVPGSVYRDGGPIEDWMGSWDTAFRLTSQEFKWVQEPDLTSNGIDVNATHWLPYLLADDFECTVTGPITDVHIWGSWYMDYLPYGYDPEAVDFVLSIHKDIPANPKAEFVCYYSGIPCEDDGDCAVGDMCIPNPGYSRPGELLWYDYFTMDDFVVGLYDTVDPPEGWMHPPNYWEPYGDTEVWQYDFFIDPDRAFWQKGSPEEPVVYWLDVQAIPHDYDAWFGWKTSREHWNDGAVWTEGEEPWVGWWEELRYPPGHPFFPESIDLAFMITGQAAPVKWSQPPVPYQDDDLYDGWDEYSVCPEWGPYVADDWYCKTSNPVSGVHWWGSFIGWSEPYPPPVMPDLFHFFVWTDVPAGVDPFSHPGIMIHEMWSMDFTWQHVGWDIDPRDPTAAPEATFLFEAEFPDWMWFWQDPEHDELYWLSIAACYGGGPPPADYPWGWKTRPRDAASAAPDDAVRIPNPFFWYPWLGDDWWLIGGGSPIEWPAGVSWDMAFSLTTPACPIADPPLTPAGENGYQKNRYISLEHPGGFTALRVTMTSMPPPYAGFSGRQCWVGPPATYCENSGVVSPPCPTAWPTDDFTGASLQGLPHCMDWSTVGVLHISDDDIVPNAVYDVQAIDCNCNFDWETNYSPPLTITTSVVWGDVVRNCAVYPCGPPDGSVGIPTDVTAVLDKFRNLGPPVYNPPIIKSRADLDQNIPDRAINFSDITFCLDAFRGATYPPLPPALWPGPDGCP